MVAYAEEVAITTFGKHIVTKMEVMQNIITKWAGECGLGINPSKTEQVLFTKKCQIPVVDPTIVNGIRLDFTVNARFQSIILDSKLSWMPNIIERVNKTTKAI